MLIELVIPSRGSKGIEQLRLSSCVQNMAPWPARCSRKGSQPANNWQLDSHALLGVTDGAECHSLRSRFDGPQALGTWAKKETLEHIARRPGKTPRDIPTRNRPPEDE